MPSGVWLLIFTLAPFFAGVSVGIAGAGVDDALGDLYLTQAVQLYENGDHDRAQAMLAAAREFSPEPADAHALSVLLAGGIRAPHVDSVLSACLAALRSKTWLHFSPIEIRKIAVGLCIRIGEYESGVLLAETGENGFLEDPDAALLYAEAVYGVGRKEEARHLAMRYAANHPDHVGLMTFRCRIDPDYRRELARLTMAGRIKPALESIVEMVLASPEEATRRMLIEMFPRTAAVHPLVFIESLRQAESVTAADVHTFIDSGWVKNMSALEIFRGILTPENRHVLESAVLEFSGEMVRDKDRDGFPERRVTVLQGDVRRVVMDENQNGVSEIDITFREGTPAEVSFLEECPGCSLRMTFDPYPQVMTLEIMMETVDSPDSSGLRRLAPQFPSLHAATSSDESGESDSGVSGIAAFLDPIVPDGISVGNRRSPNTPLISEPMTASFSAGTFGYACVFLPGFPSSPFVEVRRGVPSALIRSLIPKAVSVGLTQDDVLYLRGERRKVLESRDEIGESRTIFSPDGSVERRMRDFDGDGVYEMYSEYVAPNSWLHAYDLNGNDVIEFRRSDGDTPMSEWDFDEDGTVDCREYMTEDGAVRREYLFSGDDAPIAVESRDGRVRHLERAGVRERVASSPSSGVIWIGTIPEPEPEIPTDGEGLGLFSGVRVRYFSLTGTVFAEVVK